MTGAVGSGSAAPARGERRNATTDNQEETGGEYPMKEDLSRQDLAGRMHCRPLEPEDVVLPWADGAEVTFDAGAAFRELADGGYVRLTVGKWAPGRGEDIDRTANDLDGFTVCFAEAEDARLAAMALHEAADQMFRAAADLDKRRCMYRATHGREALAAYQAAHDREQADALHAAIMAAGRGAG